MGLCPRVSVQRDPPEQRPPGRNMRPEPETPRKKHGTRDRDPQKVDLYGTRQPDRKQHHSETPFPLWTE